MKVKVFQSNHNGKIEFTRAELEKLLNEVYDAGFRDGEDAQREKSTWTWTSPYRYSDSITLTNGTNCTNTIDNHTQSIDKLTCTRTADINKNDTSVVTSATVKSTPDGTITVSSVDKGTALKHVNDILASIQQIQNQPGDVFTNLAKELNF